MTLSPAKKKKNDLLYYKNTPSTALKKSLKLQSDQLSSSRVQIKSFSRVFSVRFSTQRWGLQRYDPGQKLLCRRLPWWSGTVVRSDGVDAWNIRNVRRPAFERRHGVHDSLRASMMLQCVLLIGSLQLSSLSNSSLISFLFIGCCWMSQWLQWLACVSGSFCV
ncbi:hypothetical protein CFOL_v3_33209 [Cephalotus follicularis]|uniref:Uncharacterized protein n=1 Tax=Cephalotus follicularis TaxID=3775 RepID=A0A1Q3DBD4_CEPFO|nr:hypothetical protein CFOL_v3_33209 [Cephalotus follicularis]